MVLGILLPLTVCVAAPTPQTSQSGSVADAARRAREQKSREQSKPAKIYSNEDIGDLKGAVSVVGSAPATAPPTAVAPAPAAAGATAEQPPVKDEAYWRKQFADARQKLAADAKELDILQREFNLKQQQYYSDPNQALQEQTFRRDLDTTQQQINEKKAAVERDQQAIAALEDELRKTGGNSSWAQEVAAPPAPPQPPAAGQPSTF